MEHQGVQFVSDSSDDESTAGQSAGEQSVVNDWEHAPGEGEPLVPELAPVPTFAEMRKDFLHRTASGLSLSRVDSVCELQGIVNELGSTMGDMRLALQHVGDLHARLARLLSEEKREADAVVEKHSFHRPAVGVPSFSSALANIADMFMVEMPDDQ